MRLLGVILAGGMARRFGSDKALAAIDGQPMLDHVAARLRPQCDALMVAGRDWPGLDRIDDRPQSGLGPLGGLAGALAFAGAHGFDAVLSAGCDLPGLPLDLRARLGAPNAILRGQPTIGLWDAALAGPLAAWLASAEERSIRAWAIAADARWAAADGEIANVNTPDDLAAFTRPAGPRSSR
jgi:molybdopterin-guanine dinucleotide biosynthesis protein A